MDDRTDAARRREDEAPDIRVGRHALGLLEAARASGDPRLVAEAEAVAYAAGLALAARMRASYTQDRD